MISLESWQIARHLAKLGKSQRDIAETLGISRDAVARAIKQEEYSPYDRQPTAQKELEAFQTEVEQGLRRGLNGKRLLGCVRISGYQGSAATFYRWLAQLQKEQATLHTSSRFETGPAEQAQFDWSPYTLQIGDGAARIIVYSLALGYSQPPPSIQPAVGLVTRGVYRRWLWTILQ